MYCKSSIESQHEFNLEITIFCVLPDTTIKRWLILCILFLLPLLYEFFLDLSFPDGVIFKTLNKKDTVLKQTELLFLFLWILSVEGKSRLIGCLLLCKYPFCIECARPAT